MYSVQYQILLPEQKLHGATKCLEVDQIIQSSLVLDVAEDGHSNNCIDESDKSQQSSDIEQSWERNNKREEQLPNSFSSLEPQTLLIQILSKYNQIFVHQEIVKTKLCWHNQLPFIVVKKKLNLTLISRNILPILKTLTTLRSVGDTGKSSMRSSMTMPTMDAMTRTKSNRFHAVVK